MRKSLVLISIIVVTSFLFHSTFPKKSVAQDTIGFPSELPEEDMEFLSKTAKEFCSVMDVSYSLKEQEIYSDWKIAGEKEIEELREVLSPHLFSLIVGEIKYIDYDPMQEIQEVMDKGPTDQIFYLMQGVVKKSKTYHFYITNPQEWVNYFTNLARFSDSWAIEKDFPIPCITSSFVHEPSGTRVTIYKWDNSPPDCLIDMEVD